MGKADRGGKEGWHRTWEGAWCRWTRRPTRQHKCCDKRATTDHFKEPISLGCCYQLQLHTNAITSKHSPVPEGLTIDSRSGLHSPICKGIGLEPL